MGDKPLVSVLMTAYNREDYLGEAIESVLASSYTNFELIVVDDCSKDNTVAVAKKYAAADSRIKVYQNEKNLGDYVNRNRAASHATGKYIKYWDSDDIMYPHCLDVMVRCMEQFPDAGFGLCKPHKVQYNQPYPFVIDKPFDEYIKDQEVFNSSPGAAIIKRELFNDLGGFSGKRYVGDYEFWLKISQVSQLVVIPSFLGWDRQHQQQERVFESSHYVETEKLKIDVLMDALNNGKLSNAKQLKDIFVNKRNKINNKVVVRHLVRLEINKAKTRLELSKYLLKKAGANS